MLDMKLNSSDITGTNGTQVWYQIHQVSAMETK